MREAWAHRQNVNGESVEVGYCFVRKWISTDWRRHWKLVFVTNNENILDRAQKDQRIHEIVNEKEEIVDNVEVQKMVVTRCAARLVAETCHQSKLRQNDESVLSTITKTLPIYYCLYTVLSRVICTPIVPGSSCYCGSASTSEDDCSPHVSTAAVDRPVTYM